VPPSPLVLARQGSFFVNAQAAAAPFPNNNSSNNTNPQPGHGMARGMYVQYQIPQDRDPRAYPVVMVPGASHTVKTYEETPDGRIGWAEYFVRRGAPVYLVDPVGRARSGFNASAVNGAKVQGDAASLPNFSHFTNEAAWTIFRFGPTPFVPYADTQFPVEAQEQYFAQIVPNTESSYPDGRRSTTDALAKLLDRIGPAVLLVHSLSGENGIRAALARPDLVKAVVSVEPRSCVVPDHGVTAFTRIPLLTIFGDFFGADVDDWPGRMRECVETVRRLSAAGGTAENLYLPDVGIRGNSHMLMMDRNNQQVADLILAWLAHNAPVR
jgi:pimeloyl-ACP methyl ester carboxylesterase